jgi:electron transfer flavoprotein-quinone oxidoreductase
MAKKADYDVIVVGAGFGGPVAAHGCASAGLDTLMLEKSVVPGDKVISGLIIPFYGFLFAPPFIRDGNPPLQRPIRKVVNNFVRNGEIYATDKSLWLPPPLCLTYSAYCMPMCVWLADRAVEAGAELRTRTTVVDLIMEDGKVVGVVTDKGEEIKAKVVIDSAGTQDGLAMKAGLRGKLPPDSLELYMVYDYEMPKQDVDAIIGNNLEFFIAMPEEKIAPPLGYGSTFYIFTYRESVHPGVGQFLVNDEGKVPNTARLLEEYFENFTTTVSRWRDDIAPKVKLRAKMFDVCPIYAGLNRKIRELPIYGDGILIMGDAAAMESTAFGDGVPNAWFSGAIAADVAVEAVRAGDSSASFLRRYDERIKAHGIISKSLSDTRRYDMRWALPGHDEREMRRRTHELFGRGVWRYRHITGQVLSEMKTVLSRDPKLAGKWMQMFNRYNRNCDTGYSDPLTDYAAKE